MTERATDWISRHALKNRRQAIEQRLAEFGLVRGPRRLFRGEKAADFEETRSRRLARALEGLGPIFSSFGLYMSSRADLWQVSDCLELATIPDRTVPTPTPALTRLLSREIDCSLEGPFLNFEEKPFESRLLFQSHQGRLKSGSDVIVKIIHPEVEDQLSLDIDLLSLLRDTFAGSGLSDAAFKNAVADFCHSFRQQIDFTHEARAFDALAEDAEEYEVLRAPHVYGSLCSPRLLVVQKLNGLRLDRMLSPRPDPGSNVDSRALLASVGFEQNELARLLCEVWLIQALRGRCFPVEPRSQNILILPSKQIAFTDGRFASLSTEPQANLWDYLIAAANENSDRACSCLLAETRRERTLVNDDEVRRRFRQAMPFRDGGWNINEDNESLAELLFVHWRFASECGYLPLMHLPAFYRGLFTVTETTRRLAPQIDPLMEGLRDARLIAGLTGFRELISQRQLVDQMDRYAAMMTDLPQNLDEALTRISSGDAFEVRKETTRAQPRNALVVSSALFILLAACAVMSHYLASAGVGRSWINSVSALAFVLLGAMLLRAATR